jgi:hypothetical protein
VDYGNAPRAAFRGPGINNWNVSVAKNFFIREPHRLQFRAEGYNAWNHTQFSQLNANAQYNAAGQQINAAFGQVQGTFGARVLQLSLRYMF